MGECEAPGLPLTGAWNLLVSELWGLKNTGSQLVAEPMIRKEGGLKPQIR